MFFIVAFYILGVISMLASMPTLFLIISSIVYSANPVTAASWGMLIGAIVSALICFAIASIIDRQQRIENMMKRMEEKLCPEQEDEAISPKKPESATGLSQAGSRRN